METQTILAKIEKRSLPQKHSTRENYRWYFSNQRKHNANTNFKILISFYNQTPWRPSLKRIRVLLIVQQRLIIVSINYVVD